MDIKIILKIKDIEIEFTKEEIMELKDTLDDLFQTKSIPYYIPYTVPEEKRYEITWSY